MKIVVDLDGRAESGGAPLVMHNPRLADPLDEHTIALAALTGKRKKTLADHIEISRTEFEGALYFDEGLGPVLPGIVVLRCIQAGAKAQKLGASVLRALIPIADSVPLEYDGPRTIQALWEDGRFALRKTVMVQRSMTNRTRPIFQEWRARVPFELDLTQLDLHKVSEIVAYAGRYYGLLEMRPFYGRFKGTVEAADREEVGT